jgi:hypothetical protein
MNKLEQLIADKCGFRKIAGLEYSNSDLNIIRITAKICLEIAEESYSLGKERGHWEGRLAILNLPGINYGGSYLEGAERNVKKSTTFDQFKQEIL